MVTQDFYSDEYIRQQIYKLKKKFLLEYLSDPDSYDSQDVDELFDDPTKEWNFKRFLLNSYLNLDKAFDQLCACYRWKKEIGVRYMSDQDFPLEFFAAGALIPYEADLNGNPCLYIRVKFMRRAQEIMHVCKLFFVHQMNKVDTESEGFGWTLIFDFSGANINNCDLEMVNFLINAICDYYPCGVDYILTYELPWYLSAMWKVIRSCIPDHSKGLVRCADKKTITNFISLDNLPDFMGGRCKRSYREIPKGCVTTQEYGSKILGLSKKQLANLLHKFKPLLVEVCEHHSEILLISDLMA